jgi:hypothetical protein
MVREKDKVQINKAIELINAGKVHAAFQALSFKCKCKPIRLAIRYAEFTARLMILQDNHLSHGNQNEALHYYDCLQSMRLYVNELNDKGGKL